MAVTMQAGKFFRDTNNDLWICYRQDLSGPPEQLFHCLRVKDERVVRYDATGKAEKTGTAKHTLSSGPL